MSTFAKGGRRHKTDDYTSPIRLVSLVSLILSLYWAIENNSVKTFPLLIFTSIRDNIVNRNWGYTVHR